MVFFCCDGCSETLKKNQVDAHAARCRTCASVCCVDCNVSFFGDDYRAHTSCITESERYEGKFAKQAKRNPQQEWMDLVTSCSSTAPMHLKGYFRTMSSLDNIPRKEKQFRNFTSNSLGLRGANEKVVGEIWNVLKAEREKRQAVKQEQMEKAKEKKKQQQEESQKVKEKKVASDDDESEDEVESKTKEPKTKNSDDIDPKRIKKVVKKALRKAPNRSMKIKELRKLLGDKLGVPKSEKKRLKDLIAKAPSIFKKDQIKVDGKIITLI
mmetsp:Transcript_109190/g.163321  ORF Transcript_109190/g.163321 Transcript_109190/m.163321 type:complete len:268 (-) Transcript_109190:7-810(-)